MRNTMMSLNRARHLVVLMTVVAATQLDARFNVLEAQSAPASAARWPDNRIGAHAVAQITAIIDSSAATGLPTAPLIDKALEGASKGADDQRIVVAVRTVATYLGAARTTLGATVNADELASAASALRAGASAKTLAAIRQAFPSRSLVIPYAVVGALIARGVPDADAATAILARGSHADDKALLAFSTAVEKNMGAGLPVRVAIARAGTGDGSVASVPTTGVLSGPRASAGSGKKPKP